MRIGMLAANPAGGHGWARYTRGLINALVNQGVEVVLLTSREAPRDPAALGLPVQGYHRVLPSLTPARRLTGPRMFAVLPRVVTLTARCDLVHIISEPYALIAPAKPTVVTAHGTYLPQTLRRRTRGLYRVAYRRAHIICVSHYTERRVLAVMPGLRTRVIPNGVEADRFRNPPPPGVLSMTRALKRGPTIVAVGQVKARKGYHVLVAAMNHIRNHIPDAQAVCIGDTTSDAGYMNALTEQIRQERLGDAVHFLGRVPEETLLSWLHSAEVFALPAVNVGDRFEGFGLVYLEASAAGLPVIGTRDNGAEDAIRDGETGLLVPQNDPESLAEAAIRLLGDADLRLRMGTAGQALAGQLTWEGNAAHVMAMYKAALGSHA